MVSIFWTLISVFVVSALSVPIVKQRAINSSPCGFTKVPYYNEERIVGGTNAKKGQYPWMISLLYHGFYHVCGGTIIDDNWVLTAAHCFESSSTPSYYAVRAGAYDISQYDSNIKDYAASKIIQHEKWNSANFRNDIALIKLRQPFNFTSYYMNRICLPTVSPYNVDGNTAKIVGWGDTKNVTGTDMAGILQQADITVLNSSGCSSYWNSNMYNHESQLCAKSTTTATCVGDSGGPAMIADATTNAYIQIGVSSFTSSSGCLTAYPVVFARISYYYSWITSTIANN